MSLGENAVVILFIIICFKKHSKLLVINCKFLLELCIDTIKYGINQAIGIVGNPLGLRENVRYGGNDRINRDIGDILGHVEIQKS